MDNSIRELINQAVDETISRDDFERLQNLLEEDSEVRQAYLRTVRLVHALGEYSSSSKQRESSGIQTEQSNAVGSSMKNGALGRLTLGKLALAASILVIVGAAAFWGGRGYQNNLGNTVAQNPVANGSSDNQRPDLQQEETQIAGHATLRRAVDLSWASDSSRMLEGDVLTAGRLAFAAGIVEIDFFSGATLIVEGPAELDIESDWSVRVVEGKLRAIVPNAARGFIVKAADSQIIDLGTEFAVQVDDSTAQVEVIDGEVELRGGKHDGKHLLTGDYEALQGRVPAGKLASSLSSLSDLQRRKLEADQASSQRWRDFAKKFESDERVIANYPIAELNEGREVPNHSFRGKQFNGLMVGPVNKKSSRFGASSGGLGFSRPGARVRTRIDGEFTAFTFSTWVRIDNLSHRYNALFMADGYENGEPHWQIRDDGAMMISVMVDETEEVRHFNKIDQQVVRDAGLHRVYYTPPIWDISKSGHWFHLAAVYDPVGKKVRQYVNGKEVSSHEIEDKYLIESLRIGPAEIGNWGQPFRKTPWFAVRNLSGTVDELTIWNAALSGDEILEIYEEGKPVGY